MDFFFSSGQVIFEVAGKDRQVGVNSVIHCFLIIGRFITGVQQVVCEQFPYELEGLSNVRLGGPAHGIGTKTVLKTLPPRGWWGWVPRCHPVDLLPKTLAASLQYI